MKKHRIWPLLAALALALALNGCAQEPAGGGAGTVSGQNGGTADIAPVVSGPWVLTGEWTRTQDGGAETLEVTSAGSSAAWNTQGELGPAWSVSTQLQLLPPEDGVNCGRLVFGDAHQNVELTVTVEYQGLDQVQVRADMLLSTGWRNLYTGKDWTAIDPQAPVTLTVRREAEETTLSFTLAQGEKTLIEDHTKRVADRVMDTLVNAGVAVHDSHVRFSDFRVEELRAPVQEETVPPTVPEVIQPGEHVDTTEWTMGEHVTHNLRDGGSVLILDGMEEVSSWNTVNTLSDSWTVTVDVLFGASSRGSVCSRFMFGPEAVDRGSFSGLFTVNYDSSRVQVQMQTQDSGGWTTVGGSDWVDISGKRVTVRLARYEDRIAVTVTNNGRPVIQELSDPLPQSTLDAFRHYGVMVYSSQVEFSNFSFQDTADEADRPSTQEKVYPVVNELTLGTAEESPDYDLSAAGSFFRENGGDALCIDSKGEEYAYYRGSLSGAWSLAARVRFGRYYSDTAGCRVTLTDGDRNKTALLTLKYSPSDGRIFMTLETMKTDWTEDLRVDWRDGAGEFDLLLTMDEAGTLQITVRDLNGRTLLEEQTALDGELLGRISALGLGTLESQTKYSAIAIEP